GIDRVVGRIGACGGDAIDRHGFGSANVLIGEAGAGVAGREAVASHAVVRESDRGTGGAVIDFVGTGRRYAQGTGGDVSSGAGAGRSELIVASVDAAQAQVGGRDGFVGADHFGRE